MVQCIYVLGPDFTCRAGTIFFIRRQQGCDEVDTALVDRRWLLPCANTKSGTTHNSTGRVVVCNIPVAAEQRIV